MGFVAGIVLIVGGILAASSVIVKKKPEAKEMIEKLAQFQGYIGIVLALWGIWGVISSILNLGWLGTWPIWWITYLAANVVSLLVGIILGYGLIQQYALAKASDEQKKKAEEVYQKLVGFQIPLGWIAIAIGIWTVVYRIIR